MKEKIKHEKLKFIYLVQTAKDSIERTEIQTHELLSSAKQIIDKNVVDIAKKKEFFSELSHSPEMIDSFLFSWTISLSVILIKLTSSQYDNKMVIDKTVQHALNDINSVEEVSIEEILSLIYNLEEEIFSENPTLEKRVDLIQKAMASGFKMELLKVCKKPD